MLKSIICPSFDPKVPLQHLVTSAPLLRGTKVGGDDAPVVFLLDKDAQPLGPNNRGRESSQGDGSMMARCFFWMTCFFFLKAVVVVFCGFNEWSLVAQFLHIHTHKLNLDQSFLGLPNFDPGGYDTIYEIFRKNFGETSASKAPHAIHPRGAKGFHGVVNERSMEIPNSW